MCRAACPPTRSWKSTTEASDTPATTSDVAVTRTSYPYRANIRRETPATSATRSDDGSTRHSSVSGSSDRSRANPSTSSGVYVDPPPMTVSFIP